MHRHGYKALAALGAVGLAAGFAAFDGQVADAADHTDPPAAFAAPGNAADIGDLYAWSDGTNMNVIVTFAGASMPTAENAGAWESGEDILYKVMIDTDGSVGGATDAAAAMAGAEHEIMVRFSTEANAAGDWGMMVENFPGAAGNVMGAVGSSNAVTEGGQFYAGVHDDPFFFDLAGFQATVANVTDDDMNGEPDLAFTGADFFAGTNTSAIVLQFPLSAITLTADTPVQVWATTMKQEG